MNENTKKIALIVVVIVALALAGFGASKLFSTEQPIVERVVPMAPGQKSMKQMEMEAQNGGGKAAPSGRSEGDLASVGAPAGK